MPDKTININVNSDLAIRFIEWLRDQPEARTVHPSKVKKAISSLITASVVIEREESTE